MEGLEMRGGRYLWLLILLPVLATTPVAPVTAGSNGTESLDERIADALRFRSEMGFVAEPTFVAELERSQPANEYGVALTSQ
jgi:hypothetical protein